MTHFLHRVLAAGIALLTALPLAAQNRTVTGTVTDARSGEPLVGVTVTIQGTTLGATTGLDGVYTLQFPADLAGGGILHFNYLGYNPVQETIGSRTAVDVQLAEEARSLDAVVVIGYGTATKKELTGSVASLGSDDMNTGSFTSAAGLLQGKVAGLTVTNPSGGDPAASFEIMLRGTNTLAAGQGPLVIIDGVVGADIRNINFQEVENIDVLKDGSAAAIYGTRGTNGVVIITTKRASKGSTSLEYDGQVSVQTVLNRAKPMSAREFEHTINNYAPSNAGSLYGYDTDWFDEITRTPISHKHSVALSGGSEKFSHRTILNVEQNQGLQRRNTANKYMFKTNIRQSVLDGWLDLDYNAFYTRRDAQPANYDAFRQAFFHNPTEPVYDRQQGGGRLQPHRRHGLLQPRGHGQRADREQHLRRLRRKRSRFAQHPPRQGAQVGQFLRLQHAALRVAELFDPLLPLAHRHRRARFDLQFLQQRHPVGEHPQLHPHVRQA